MEDMGEMNDYSEQTDDRGVIKVDMEGNEQDHDQWIIQCKP